MEKKKEIIDVEATPVEENKPTLEVGNYIIEVKSNGQVIKKFVAANAEINIQRLAEGGLTVDLNN
ncbi:hypothetical protein HF846_17345 [Clostridium cadaveris]|uniref:hypothetical protein n=1 Tax=Clostridium cadaveris TaxID=1529 RepID=UPI001459D2E8|nr:hypothetical protein [Clostridium cadaveris]MDM8313642.1 hypothetical protein [Clostridium cadaveris]NME66336.1 hypothetical protein [Clostridium cadaveris]NWK12906.1 hypothetical protein [Clostridium cadaveris]